MCLEKTIVMGSRSTDDYYRTMVQRQCVKYTYADKLCLPGVLSNQLLTTLGKQLLMSLYGNHEDKTIAEILRQDFGENPRPIY